MEPTCGRIVHYRLTKSDCGRIIAQRGDRDDKISLYQGNKPSSGDVVPLVVVRHWGESADGTYSVNGQAILDGNDTLWVTSAHGPVPSTDGCWAWPEHI